ncbi:hypothetical protein CEE45_16040 [Candidatus Heimdallarchaeota archaeon B3_Heim]|nr:MAG: hypothetical protein CEE45_16040 [Candidatus Heimdallarchaeota archaeon B3_Heim]
MSIWNRKKFGISQRHRRQLSLQEAYHIRDPDSNQNMLWVKRKRFGRKTNIRLWESEDTTEGKEALTIQDDAMFDAFGKFSIIDPNSGAVLAVLKRHFFRSLLREKWTIRDPKTSEELVTVQARSLPISLVRNLRWLPILNAFDFFIQFIRLQWDFLDCQTGKKIGYFDRKFTIGDNYILDFQADTENKIDSRVAVGLGVVLDTAESR